MSDCKIIEEHVGDVRLPSWIKNNNIGIAAEDISSGALVQIREDGKFYNVQQQEK